MCCIAYCNNIMSQFVRNKLVSGSPGCVPWLRILGAWVRGVGRNFSATAQFLVDWFRFNKMQRLGWNRFDAFKRNKGCATLDILSPH